MGDTIQVCLELQILSRSKLGQLKVRCCCSSLE